MTGDPVFNRNSVLDASGDVVLHQGTDGRQYVFRDRVQLGLILHEGPADHWWTLTPDGADQPVCEGGWSRQGAGYVALDAVSGERIARADTMYGLIAKAARRYLKVGS